MPEGGTPIAPGLIARAVQGARYVISGVTPDSWFGPSQPLAPMAPADVAGRRYDYPFGINLDQRPRGYEPVTFDQLRFLADNCDVLRSVIETRKDQMEAMDWTIRPRLKDKNVAPTDEQLRRIDAITTFLQSPDRCGSWSQWQRQLLEDRFVIDAATLYKRRDRRGRLYALEIMDGATVKLLLDETGRRPVPPDPAYQQILKGVPAVDYTAEELLYLVRNPRSWKLYGYSEVEQIIVTVNIAIRRALHQLDYYSEGSQPDAFMGLPKDWNPDQIAGFQKHFDAQMSGNLAARRKLKFMPGEFKYQETKQPPLKDMYDEWLARIICHAFSISPEPFVQHTNRGTAETSHDRAIQEGLAPLQRWIKNIVDPVIALEFDSSDLEFAWADDREQDPMQAAQIREQDTKAGIISVDEAREEMGKDPLGGAYALPMLATATGYVAPTTPEEQQQARESAQQATQQAAEAPNDADKPPKKEPEAQKTAYTALRKAVRPKPIPFDREVTRHARAALKAKVAKVLKATGKDVASQVRKKFGKLAKDEADDEATRQRAIHIAEIIDLSALNVLADTAPQELEAVLADSGTLALAQLGVADRSELVDQIHDRAVQFARDRAAEMVGKRWRGDTLIDNPNAEWRIDEATRDELRGVIEQGLQDNIGSDAIADAIRHAGAFSEDRADLIAHTEITWANGIGTLEGYKAAKNVGVKVKKVWLPDEGCCDICQENADAGAIDLEEDFPSGDPAPPSHPNCECSLTNEIEEESGETEEEDTEE